MSTAPSRWITPGAPLAPRPRPERLLIVARRVEDGRFLFARWPDWPHPAMLSTLPPRGEETPEAAVETLLYGRLGVHLEGAVRRSEVRLPVRMLHPAGGGAGLGWLRPLAATVSGVPAADALLETVETLTFDEAIAALPTDLERAAFRAGAALFDAGPDLD